MPITNKSHPGPQAISGTCHNSTATLTETQKPELPVETTALLAFSRTGRQHSEFGESGTRRIIKVLGVIMYTYLSRNSVGTVGEDRQVTQRVTPNAFSYVGG